MDDKSSKPAFERASNPGPRPPSRIERKIQDLEQLRHRPVASPGLHPPGVRGSATLSHQQREANTALDKLIAYWEKQDPMIQKAKDRAKVTVKENDGNENGHGR